MILFIFAARFVQVAETIECPRLSFFRSSTLEFHWMFLYAIVFCFVLFLRKHVAVEGVLKKQMVVAWYSVLPFRCNFTQ